jgi:hypothetical protein
MKETLSVVLSFVLIILAAFAINLLIYGAIVWVLVWALNALGVYTIGSFVVAFSWKLVIIVALVASLFTTRISVHRD